MQKPNLLAVKHFCFAACLLLAAMFVFVPQTYAFTVENVRLGVHESKTRIVFDLSEVEDFRAFVLQDPWRLVIDMPTFAWQNNKVSLPPRSGVSSVRHGALNGGISRIVLDLDQTHVIQSAFHIKRTPAKPPRLVIDVRPASMSEYMAQKGKIYGKLTVDRTAASKKTSSASTDGRMAGKTASPAAAVKQVDNRPVVSDAVRPSVKPTVDNVVYQQKQAKPFVRHTVVIDAGHGGADPGAIGANGVFEKNVVLAIAKDLKRKLERTGRYNVLLTRDTDKFIRLYKRVEFARNNNADLFVSIHADTIGKSSVRGASVYTLSEKASDAQTAKLAARENKADQIAGVDLSHEDKQVADILVDLVMRDTMNQSNFLANTLVVNMKQDGMRVLENPHRSAGFAVLKAPDIPSILIEVGFLSNRSEAAMLSRSDYRGKVANSIMSGVEAYFSTVDRNKNM